MSVGALDSKSSRVISEIQAGMVKLVDALDSKSSEGNLMRVRFSLPASAFLNSINKADTALTFSNIYNTDAVLITSIIYLRKVSVALLLPKIKFCKWVRFPPPAP